jgi:hypothetical protein
VSFFFFFARTVAQEEDRSAHCTPCFVLQSCYNLKHSKKQLQSVFPTFFLLWLVVVFVRGWHCCSWDLFHKAVLWAAPPPSMRSCSAPPDLQTRTTGALGLIPRPKRRTTPLALACRAGQYPRRGAACGHGSPAQRARPLVLVAIYHCYYGLWFVVCKRLQRPDPTSRHYYF